MKIKQEISKKYELLWIAEEGKKKVKRKINVIYEDIECKLVSSDKGKWKRRKC